MKDKFQKRKEREQKVKKKILARREELRSFAKEEKKKYLLEKETKKGTPARKVSPEAQEVIEMMKRLDTK